METRNGPIGRLARGLALISLTLGLIDAARLLGVTSGQSSPLALLGPAGFVTLLALCLARLFASVGLWIHASWGAVLLGAAIGVELVLFVSGSGLVSLGMVGFAVKCVVLLATMLLLLAGRQVGWRRVRP